MKRVRYRVGDVECDAVEADLGHGLICVTYINPDFMVSDDDIRAAVEADKSTALAFVRRKLLDGRWEPQHIERVRMVLAEHGISA